METNILKGISHTRTYARIHEVQIRPCNLTAVHVG